MPAQVESDLPLINAFWTVIFTALAFLWPVALLISMFSLSAHNGKVVPLVLLFLATIAYGPAYLIVRLKTRRPKRERAYEASVRAWLTIFGSNVLIWIVAFLLAFL